MSVIAIRGAALTAAAWRPLLTAIEARGEARIWVAPGAPVEPLLAGAIRGEAEGALAAFTEAHRALAEGLSVAFEAVAGPALAQLGQLVAGLALTGVRSPTLDARITHQAAAVLAALIGACTRAAVQAVEAEHLDGPRAVDVRAAQDAVAQGTGCEIWCPAGGLFTADPAQVPHARRLLELDFGEARELLTAGAAGPHPRCLGPLAAAELPLEIRPLDRPDRACTRVVHGLAAAPAVKAVACRGPVALVSMQTLGMWQQVGFLAKVFTVFAEQGVSVDLVSTAETDVTVSLDSTAVDFETLLAALRPHCTPRLITECAAVSLVGRGIRAMLHRLGPALSTFEEHRVHLVSQAASDVNFTVVVDSKHAQRLVADLHARFFTTPSAAVGGPAQIDARPTWWRTRAGELLNLADAGTPAYIYEEGTISLAARALKRMSALDRVHYAIKANDHPDVLRTVRRAGLHFECVSLGEVAHLRALFPKMSPERILFTPNFASMDEYAAGLASGVQVTIDALHPLAEWPELFDGQSVFLRLDPGRGRGHHRHVRTAGPQSKFGIAPADFARAAALAEAANCQITGLHAHAGSGILVPDAWAETAAFLAEARAHFPQARVLDLGGGLGVVSKPGQAPLDLAAVNAHLLAFRAEHPDVQLWMEPGRYVVANAGVLLARVTQVKQKGERWYVGVDAGMHTLLRPALYGAWHDIVNLSRLDAPVTRPYDVVGPICETGDTLGHGRWLPETHEGDVLLIATAGAYGRTMRSDYNRRGAPREVLL